MEGDAFASKQTVDELTRYANDFFDEYGDYNIVYGQGILNGLPGPLAGNMYKAGDTIDFGAIDIYFKNDSTEYSWYQNSACETYKIENIMNNSKVIFDSNVRKHNKSNNSNYTGPFIDFTTQVSGANYLKFTSGSGTESKPYVVELVKVESQSWISGDTNVTYDGMGSITVTKRTDEDKLDTGAMADYSSDEEAGNTPPWSGIIDSIKTITFEDGVTSVGNYAFYYCKALKTLTLADTITTIGDSAFMYRKALKEVTIPSCVTKIGAHAFGTSDVTYVDLIFERGPEGQTLSVGDSATYYCHFQYSGDSKCILVDKSSGKEVESATEAIKKGE